jgi:hypothetical protein
MLPAMQNFTDPHYCHGVAAPNVTRSDRDPQASLATAEEVPGLGVV